MKAQRPAPVVLALLIADEVIRDPRSGKFSVLGIFDVISAPSFPCRHEAIAVYLSMTGGHGTVPVALRLVDADEARPPVFDVGNVMNYPSPLALVESTYRFQGPVFPAPGEYRLQFVAAGEVLREARLKLRLVPKAGS